MIRFRSIFTNSCLDPSLFLPRREAMWDNFAEDDEKFMKDVGLGFVVQGFGFS
jgi:hypothetical protein